MLGFLTGLFAFYLFRSPFPDVHMVIRNENQSVYLGRVGTCSIGFPSVSGDLWDMNEEESIARSLYSRYGLVKGYEIESVHRIHGSTFAEILYTGPGKLASMTEIPICNFHVVNGTATVRSWIQNYGLSKYCNANQLSAPWMSGGVV